MSQVVRMTPPVSQVIETVPVYKKISGKKSAHYLSVTKLIPYDWRIVEIIPSQPVNGKMTFQIRKVV
jgi:hypothetical protein